MKIPITEQITLDLSGASSHLLIVGMTGSGKTMALYHILACLIGQNTEVYVCDFKKGSLYSLILNNVPNGDKFALSTADGLESTLQALTQTMEIRFERLADPAAPLDVTAIELNPNWRPVVLVIDEFSGAMATTEKKQAGRITDLMQKYVQLGRQANMGLILSFQKLKADTLKTDISDQMVKLLLGKANNTTKVSLFDKAVNLPRIDTSIKGSGYLERPDDPMPLAIVMPDLKGLDFRELVHQLSGKGGVS